MKRLLAAVALMAGSVPAYAQQPDAAPAGRIMGTALNVTDLDAAVKFYTEGLGMRVALTLDLGAKTETILTFGADPARPSILLMHAKDPAARKPLVQGDAFSRLVLGFADLEPVAQRLTALGYAPGPIRDAGHGARILMVRDPAGFALELVQYDAKR